MKNGDQSPSRLTIAEAALLNLRGQEHFRDVAGRKPQRVANSRTDTPATFIPSSNSGLLPTSRSLPSKLCYAYRESPSLATSDLQSNSEMDTLLQSIQNGYEDGSLDGTMRSLALDNEYLMSQQAQFRALASAALLSPNPLPITLPRGHAQARNGFTPTEELILEAHAQRLQFQARLSHSSPIFEPMPTLRRLNTNLRSFESAAHEPLQESGLTGKRILYQDTLPTISEDDFHAMGHPARSFVPTSHEFQGLVDSCSPCAPPTTSPIFVRPPSRAVNIVPPPPDYEEPGKRPKDNQSEDRAIGSKEVSCPPLFNNRQPMTSGEIKPHPSLLQESIRPNNIGSGNNNNNTSTMSCDKNVELQHIYTYSHGNARNCPEEDNGSRFCSSPASHIYNKKSPKFGEHHSTVKEGLKSPGVVSPALTYSSRTPSTLSPATPFFGSFTGSQDAFEVITTESEDMAERKLKGRVANKFQIRTITSS